MKCNTRDGELFCGEEEDLGQKVCVGFLDRDDQLNLSHYQDKNSCLLVIFGILGGLVKKEISFKNS